MPVNFFNRKQTHFILWCPAYSEPTPALFIGQLSLTNPTPFDGFREVPLQRSLDFPDLWEVAAQTCELTDGQVYWYWFKVRDANPYQIAYRVLYCTDPTAYTVDRRLLAPAPTEDGGLCSDDSASVILYRDGQLVPCDPDGQMVNWEGDASITSLPPNNRLVIYKLPMQWACSKDSYAHAKATFRDMLALVEPDATAPNFAGVEVLQPGYAHLLELGINVLELLPLADNNDSTTSGWGYSTENYFAVDFDLGWADFQVAPTASSDLAYLIKTCHQRGMRFFTDMVMASARRNPYNNVNFLDFFIHWQPVGDPTRDPELGDRDGYGGDLFKYNHWVEGYHPITGEQSWFVPAREYMKLCVAHWLTYYRVDGLRLDSVNDIASYDFLQELRDLAHELWIHQHRAINSDPGVLFSRFLVVGEDLSVPFALINQNRLDGLWNEQFKRILRQVILGLPIGDTSFEWSVRKLIDCRLLGFENGTQPVNYITSHNLGGYKNERIYNYLVSNGITDIEKRIRLAFVCLLTAVGIPMILAGEEFADQHDLDISYEKQVDPVDYSRMSDEWRKRVFNYVAKLVHLRTSSDALATDDVDFIHMDLREGKQVVVWQRGQGNQLVIVVANFSDYSTPPSDEQNAEYVISNWPKTPVGKRWMEVTYDRDVPESKVGREPIRSWEAMVYTLV